MDVVRKRELPPDKARSAGKKAANMTPADVKKRMAKPPTERPPAAGQDMKKIVRTPSFLSKLAKLPAKNSIYFPQSLENASEDPGKRFRKPGEKRI